MLRLAGDECRREMTRLGLIKPPEPGRIFFGWDRSTEKGRFALINDTRFDEQTSVPFHGDFLRVLRNIAKRLFRDAPFCSGTMNEDLIGTTGHPVFRA